MNAAKKALESCSHLFPHLDYQKKIVERSFQRQTREQQKMAWQEEVRRKRKELGLDKKYEEKKTVIPDQDKPRSANEPLEDGECSE